MNSLPIEPPSPEIESLLAKERTIDPVPDDLRMRAVGRARAEIANRLRTDSPDSRRFARPRRVTVAVAAAAGVVLVALCAVAFRAVYRSGLKDQVPPADTSAPKPRIPDLQIPAALPDKLPEASPAVTIPIEHSSKAKVVGRAKTVNDSETYVIELALLQPAYHAVARRDFTSALAAIAEHQHRFASGQLAEEREALRVKALLGLGRRAEAQSAALAFRERFPRSVLLRRLEGMLDASP
jgi:hypothetical protein